jgi:hypothetical protein
MNTRFHLVTVLGASPRGCQVLVRLACGHHYLYTPANREPAPLVTWYNTQGKGGQERCTRCYVPERESVR